MKNNRIDYGGQGSALQGKWQGNDTIPMPQEQRMEQLIALGQGYMETHVPARTPVRDLFFKQVKYLSPNLWLLQLAALIFIGTMVVFSENRTLWDAQQLMVLIGPLTAMLAIPEFSKDIACGFLELELACKNSGSTVLTLRLLAVGMLNLGTVALSAGSLAALWNLELVMVLLYGLLAVNCVHILNLGLLRLLKLRSRLSALCGAVCAAAIVYSVSMNAIQFSQLDERLVAALWLVSAVWLALQCRSMIKNIENRRGVSDGIAN